ncbi:MAG TPA: phenylalanine--tRNA ligase subunit beta [Bryobacteraceae bacterium]|jgi:phenylalanyl-tRNA synthetase beta chain|nr:phenylalanine--tRNA ligase subunit beta [Bryobacteraceae bacterium]
MKFSYNWLRELVPGLATDPSALEHLITMKTAECEGIFPAGAHFENVRAARVVSIEALPKSKNKKVRIEIGAGREASVVCGAPNVREGMMAAWVPPGTELAGRTISRAVIDGIESEGMLASADELGINRDHSGLIELANVAPGQRLPDLAPDWIIEIDNKSLTHRPDLWGHYGMAREVAAITHNALRDPVDTQELPEGAGAIKVEIADHRLCPRYSALCFDQIRVGPLPLGLQLRLESVDLNTISNIVDVTNYVLAELPQPMHAFDRDKLHGDTIYVRPAKAGERLAALNGETYTLTEADLVIADARGPIALAGVIGGTESAISETTTRIVLESANFNAASVRLTSVRHKLRTDASIRFEKSLDPENTIRGLARAAALIRQLCPSAVHAGGVTDNRAPAHLPAPIALPVSFVGRKLGKQISGGEISEILGALGFATRESSAGLLEVTVPSWRATKDISHKDDLVEEIGRMIGYGEITPAAPLVASVVPPANPMRLYLRRIRRVIADQGFTEVYNYSFLTAADAERFHFDLGEHIGVRNPIAAELTHLRRSLLPGVFKNILGNARNFQEFRVFEIGHEIHPDGNGALPDEIPHLAAAFYQQHASEQTFFEMKRVAECLLREARFRANPKPAPYMHPERAALISLNGSELGGVFELHPSLLADEGLEGRAVVLDIDLRLAFAAQEAKPFRYTPPRRYPTSGFDLSIVTEKRTPVGQLEDELRALAREHLVSLDFVRQYEGAPLAAGTKSVSHHLEIGAADHTLSSEEATRIRSAIVSGLRARNYEIRGLD